MDDGLLQDENEIEDFPDEDEEEEEARQVEETTVTPATDDYDEGKPNLYASRRRQEMNQK